MILILHNYLYLKILSVIISFICRHHANNRTNTRNAYSSKSILLLLVKGVRGFIDAVEIIKINKG